ncbi:MAG: hypothetical protein QMD65_01950 [Patescibacteria group bacterium]|nr:hypothetical protein [Patescibacteria group bacterium]
MKTCFKCKKAKNEKDFYFYKRNKDGIASYCKKCANQITIKCKKEYYKRFPTRQGDGYKKKYWKNPELYRKLNREHHQELRFDVLKGYGGEKPKCNCCGETEIKFLCIDHINNDGKAERKKFGSQVSILRYLRKMSFPKGYQVLCYNCNLAKQYYKICPHKL